MLKPGVEINGETDTNLRGLVEKVYDLKTGKAGIKGTWEKAVKERLELVADDAVEMIRPGG